LGKVLSTIDIMLLRTLFGLAATATTCLSASLERVLSFGNNPTRIQMYIYVPDNVAPNPAIIVAVGILLAKCSVCFVKLTY